MKIENYAIKILHKSGMMVEQFHYDGKIIVDLVMLSGVDQNTKAEETLEETEKA